MRIRNILLVAALVAAGTAMPTSAWAEPTGCSHTKPSFWLSGASGRYLMNAQSTGTCSSYSVRTFRVEIKHDISFSPDPVVSHAEDSGNDRYFEADTHTCDAGDSGTYYGRSFFTQNATYHDSDHFHVDAC
jgi:hypothetical protein